MGRLGDEKPGTKAPALIARRKTTGSFSLSWEGGTLYED